MISISTEKQTVTMRPATMDPSNNRDRRPIVLEVVIKDDTKLAKLWVLTHGLTVVLVTAAGVAHVEWAETPAAALRGRAGLRSRRRRQTLTEGLVPATAQARPLVPNGPCHRLRPSAVLRGPDHVMSVRSGQQRRDPRAPGREKP